MTNYRPGDLVLVAFPFAAGTQGKHRPALVILDTGDADVLVARVTTQTGHSDHDVRIEDWKGAGLLAPSTVRLHKLAMLEKSLVQRCLGSIQGADRAAISEVLRRTYGNW
jgi:mRNA interferase MazF